jgi:hypothetical protein
VASVIPYIEGGTITGRLGTRNIIGDDVSWTTFVGRNPYTGELDFTSDAVFFRVEIEIDGDWTTAQGLAPRIQPSGDA